MNDIQLVEKFNSMHKNIIISYGGDGELLRTALLYPSKSILPVRNYARCSKHQKILEDLCNDDITDKDFKYSLKYSKAPYLEAKVIANSDDIYKGIAEIVLKSNDPTEALRFSVIVNGKTYMQQCIADGLIFASKLGSHGYFKSVTRTLFTDVDSVGIGFIAPTYGICNLVLKNTDKIAVKFERSAKICIAYDKNFSTIDMQVGSEIELQQSAVGISLFGYDVFCCQECRNLRNSTIVNDKYIG